MPTTQEVHPTEATDPPSLGWDFSRYILNPDIQVSMEIISKLPTQIKLKNLDQVQLLWQKTCIFLEKSKHEGLSYPEYKLAMQKNNSAYYTSKMF